MSNGSCLCLLHWLNPGPSRAAPGASPKGEVVGATNLDSMEWQ